MRSLPKDCPISINDVTIAHIKRSLYERCQPLKAGAWPWTVEEDGCDLVRSDSGPAPEPNNWRDRRRAPGSVGPSVSPSMSALPKHGCEHYDSTGQSIALKRLSDLVP